MKVPAYLEGSREWFCPLQLDSDMRLGARDGGPDEADMNAALCRSSSFSRRSASFSRMSSAVLGGR